ncbi:MAG: hypothetical protein U0Y82_06310 [Thermoleophilia bacterium]
MDQYSLTEILLDRLMQETGLAPAGDLVQRLERTPPAILRGLRARDTETVGIAAALPMDMSSALAELLEQAVGDDGRFDRAKADAYMADQAGQDEDEEDIDDRAVLMAVVHNALGLPIECEACAGWVLDQDRDEPEADEHGHHEPESLVEAVYAAHPEAVDDWPQQTALRIAAHAGDVFGSAAGFGALHEVVAHATGVPGLSREGLAEAHRLQHTGMARCEDIAEAHVLGVALRAMTGAGGVAARIGAAEMAAVEDAMALASLPAAVAVGLVAQEIETGLASTPTPPPGRRLPKSGRKRR